MATIRKRGDKWQAQIRRDNAPPISKTFHLKEDAVKWSRSQELAIDRGEDLASTSVPDEKLLILLRRYEVEVTPNKRSAHSESYHLRHLKGHPIAQIGIARVTPVSVAKYRDDRLKSVAGPTVRKELTLLSSVIKIAMTEWGYVLKQNAVSVVRKPPNGRPRDRRLECEDLVRLVKALDQCRNPLIKEVFLFALATGMRRGEVLSLTWPNTNLDRKTALLPITKNGEARLVPLSPDALSVLIRRRFDREREASSAVSDCAGLFIFPVSANGFRMAWERVKRRAGVEDLRFHDLRHEAISRFFEIGLSVPEVSLISGHRDARMLLRHTHLKADDIARKLGKIAETVPSMSTRL